MTCKTQERFAALASAAINMGIVLGAMWLFFLVFGRGDWTAGVIGAWAVCEYHYGLRRFKGVFGSDQTIEEWRRERGVGH